MMALLSGLLGVLVLLALLRVAAIMFVLLAGLYAILYSLLQLEDDALLMGTGLLLAVVSILMYVTRYLRAGSAEALADDGPEG